jgi:phage baseplate assembly protein W
MPVEIQKRVSLGFKDINMSFKKNPLTNDLIVVKNENAIAQSVKNLVLTGRGERLFNPNIGSGLAQALFENIDVISASQIQSEINSLLRDFEPRINLTDVKVDPDFENNAFNVTVEYEITGINTPIQVLRFPLTKTR